jgi:hypothetical protein
MLTRPRICHLGEKDCDIATDKAPTLEQGHGGPSTVALLAVWCQSVDSWRNLLPRVQRRLVGSPHISGRNVAATVGMPVALLGPNSSAVAT